MRRKPKGVKYRNLHARGSVIVYERVLHGRRIKRSLGVDDWHEAAAIRDALEARIGADGMPRVTCPTFAEAAETHLESLTHLAETTLEDRRAMLGKDGPLVEAFGAMRLDGIRRVHLLDWWGEFVERGNRSPKTGRNYLDALSGVFIWGIERELIDENPVEGLRAVLRRRNQTKRGRAENEAGTKARPIEKATEVAALVAQAAGQGGSAYLATLLMLDAGLRLGEATALDWRDVDLDRHALHIRASLSRGKHLGRTKSGRERPVALIRRLRQALREAWMRDGKPESGFVSRIDHANYRNRVLKGLCEKTEIGSYTPHNLRDTYASQLLSVGVQLAYVSHQLGHADVAVTAKHYARWCGEDAWRPPLTLEADDVPADLLARLGAESHQSPTTTAEA